MFGARGEVPFADEVGVRVLVGEKALADQRGGDLRFDEECLGEVLVRLENAEVGDDRRAPVVWDGRSKERRFDLCSLGVGAGLVAPSGTAGRCWRTVRRTSFARPARVSMSATRVAA